MQRDGVYDEFIEIVTQEYGRVFSEPLNEETQEFCLPLKQVEDRGLIDFTTCSF
jgi:hypothetical protein